MSELQFARRVLFGKSLKVGVEVGGEIVGKIRADITGAKVSLSFLLSTNRPFPFNYTSSPKNNYIYHIFQKQLNI